MLQLQGAALLHTGIRSCQLQENVQQRRTSPADDTGGLAARLPSAASSSARTLSVRRSTTGICRPFCEVRRAHDWLVQPQAWPHSWARPAPTASALRKQGHSSEEQQQLSGLQLDSLCMGTRPLEDVRILPTCRSGRGSLLCPGCVQAVGDTGLCT